MLRVGSSKPRWVIKMSQYLSGHFFALTDKGRVRELNEDYAQGAINAYGNVLLAVADGMGGANKGEYASMTLVKHVVNSFLSIDKEFKNERVMTKWINSAVREANHKILLKGEKDPAYKGAGTTLSLCLIVKDILLTAQVGDSRIYLLKDNILEQISADQTYVNYLTQTHKISEKDASIRPDRHKLTNALGTKKTVNVDIKIHPYHKEKILLCSDGLYNNVPLTDLSSIVQGNDSLDKKCMQLVAFGNANGGSDNMAVIIWEADK